MELAYLYTKPRSDFGRHCDFHDVNAKIIETIPGTDQHDNEYVHRRPMVTQLDTMPHMSEHEVNTERLITKNSSMRHSEGGWPKDVDQAEQGDVQRFRKKVEKDEDYKMSVKYLGPIVDRCLKQNNTADIYQTYFEHMGEPTTTEQPSAKGLAVFRDPGIIKRTISKIDWHPENACKMAASYCILNFQDPKFMNNTRMPVNAYIWDIMNPNTPETTLKPASPLVCMRYNPKSPDTLVGGSYNGLITFFDVRKSGSSPAETSIIEHSHHDPVYDVYWISSKTGNQCCSVSTDGSMLWWDIRHLAQPTFKLQLSDKDGQILGGSSLEYNTEAGPTKYLVGTEQGIVLSVNLRNSKQNNGITVYDTGSGKHHGPIYSIQRNPVHNKFFMTIGDWTARLWCEDLRTPIMNTTYHESYVTAGCWSPTRAGVFFVTRMDGVVDVWDFFYRQNEVAYSHKVGDMPLSSISVQACTSNSTGGTSNNSGRLIAVGDTNGMISLMELSDGLASSQMNEKLVINSMFERETKREKNLEAREKEQKRKKQNFEDEKTNNSSTDRDTNNNNNNSSSLNLIGEDMTTNSAAKDDKMEELLRQVDANFLSMIKEAEDSENKSMEHKTEGIDNDNGSNGIASNMETE